jgi:hypothetical protein
MNVCRRKPKYSEKTCPSATLFTTDPTWTTPGLKLGRHLSLPLAYFEERLYILSEAKNLDD